MSTINRRGFLKASTLFALAGPTVFGNVIGANERVRLGVGGTGGRGTWLADQCGSISGVEIVFAVDADTRRMNHCAELIEKKYGKRPQCAQDYRKLLDEKSIDAVLIGSCNHWHALMSIWACQAGKHVYVEKPCCQNMHEGRKMLQAAEKYKRLVQHGTHRRSENASAITVAAVRNEKYGKLLAVKAVVRRPRGSIGVMPVKAPPESVDWNLWLGPAPTQDYRDNFFNYNWHWHWDTGNGEIGNNGVHHFDVLTWALGEKHPENVVSFGTRFIDDAKNHYRDQAETPNIQFAYYNYGDVPMIYETCNIAGPKESWPCWERAEFHTEAGILSEGNFFPKEGGKLKIEGNFDFPGSGGPCGNFIAAIRDSVPLNAPISKGYYGAALCHWANAAYRTGKTKPLVEVLETLNDNPVLRRSVDTVLDNVRNHFKGRIRLEEIPWTVSPVLAIDKENECFQHSPEGDRFLTRTPRPPFVVPDEV